PAWALEPRAGVTRYGAFDPAGRLIGKANDLHHQQWWGGGILSAADIGGLAVKMRNGMLTRSGPPFPPPGDRFPEKIDGLTVVEDGTRLVGFASWSRGLGYKQDAVLQVGDAMAVTAEAARELIGVLASWRSVVSTVRFRALLSGAVTNELPLESATAH